jgi:hypothetical protein
MKNDIKTRIDKFIKKYPEPYQFKITLEWKRKDGPHTKTYFPNNESGGSRYYYQRSINGFWTRTGKEFIAQHYRYDEKLGLLELAYAVFDCHVPKVDENRRWKYSYRYFIPKDTRELYDVDGNQGRYDYKLVSYDGYVFAPDKFAQMFYKVNCDYEMFRREFMAFAGDNLQLKYSWRTHMTKDSSPWELEYWFLYKPKTKTTGKVQKAIDELASTTPDLPEDILDMIKNKIDSQDTYGGRKCAWLDLDRKCFRCFIDSNNGVVEDKRVYLADKGKFIVATINPSKEWVTNGSFTYRQFNFEVVNIDDVFKLPYCGYLKDVIGEKSKNLYCLVSAMRNAEIEQLANMGMHNLAKYLYGHDNIAAYIKDIFGVPNKKRNILAKYGLNKKQLEYVDNQAIPRTNGYGYSYTENVDGIKNIKKYMAIYNIASLDYDTFVKYYNFVNSLDWYARRSLEDMAEDVRQKVITKLSNMQVKHDTAVNVFFDTLNTYHRISRDNRPNVDIYNIKTYSELVRLHDTCIELKRLEDEERRRLYDMEEAERHALLEKKMAKLDEERNRFNYSDADFTIRLPEKLSEIVNEGSSLRHCVGGYTRNHAEGHTTIMFLRRNDDPTTSFYTIEIGNNDNIVQIHGFGNKWLGNNPEAIPTVMRWIKENNLHCTDEILLSTATGYWSGNAKLVEKPII